MEEPTLTPPTDPAPASGGDAPAQNWRLWLELSAAGFFVIPPLGMVIGPLILWLVKKDEPVVAAEGKRVLNFNISWMIWGFVTCGIGYFVWGVFAIIAIIKASSNERYDHPLTIQFLK